MSTQNELRYFLTVGLRAERLEITSAEFDLARTAYLVNQRCLALEEKYVLILQNFAEFERILHTFALERLLFGHKPWSEYNSDIQAANGRLLNFLSSTKAYLDQVPQHLNDIFGPACEQSAAFVASTNSEFDQSFAYRVMSAVRNHVQHSDFPIQLIRHSSRWDEQTTGLLCRHQTTVLLDLQLLVANDRNRSQTRAELSELTEKQLDMKAMVRGYLSSMAKLHTQLRQSVREIAMHNESTVSDFVSRFTTAFHSKTAGLFAAAFDGNEISGQSVPVFIENAERRNHLIARSSVILNMEKHCISSEV